MVRDSRRLLLAALVSTPLAVGVVTACSSFSGDAVDSTSSDTGVVDSKPPLDASPSDAAAPRDFLYVFVSSAAHIGQFAPPVGGSAVNGFDGANAFCKGLADASPFEQLRSLKWVAWLAAGAQKEPWRRLPVAANTPVLSKAYHLRDGAEVFPRGFRFETTLDDAGATVRAVPKAGIVLDDQAAVSRANLSVWTGTSVEMATHPSNCGGWNADLDAGMYGLLGTTSDLASWSHSSNLGAPLCTEVHHVYCFEVP